MAAKRYQFFHSSVVRALLDLSHPERSVYRPLVRGQASGEMHLSQQLFPPDGVHRDSFPARFTLRQENGEALVVHLMVSLVNNDEAGSVFVLGFLAHEQMNRTRLLTSLIPRLPAEHHFVAVRYNPITREGNVFLYPDLYDLLKQAHARDPEVPRYPSHGI